jgi:hypothetical protein
VSELDYSYFVSCSKMAGSKCSGVKSMWFQFLTWLLSSRFIDLDRSFYLQLSASDLAAFELGL